jgi:hypothetical protein
MRVRWKLDFHMDQSQYNLFLMCTFFIKLNRIFLNISYYGNFKGSVKDKDAGVVVLAKNIRVSFLQYKKSR